MLHLFTGNIGHFCIVLSFVCAFFSCMGYLISTFSTDLFKATSWKKWGRVFFLVHGLSVGGVVISLFTIIYNHYYEYHYAWSHSSNNLPIHYIISCFWEGQEGSFLLWISWHVLLGFLLINSANRWEVSVMSIFMLIQTFLLSMVLGVVVSGKFKIGSSPFMLTRDVNDSSLFQINPEFIPSDGAGLNPLLQNYWMVIHPPTLFLGFALTLIPFSFAIAGILTKRYTDWIKPALIWAYLSALILGLGIMMGAYWAYETLNFGGYWNWDPVENAVYIPWITLIASVHLMVLSKKRKAALKPTFILVTTTFILILYATFLTRSGILGESSVHSFTDLGLSAQLILFLSICFLATIILLAKAWKHIPSDLNKISVYSSDFWLFIGSAILCLSAFQIIIPTSIPVYNAFLHSFNIESNVAPPTNQVLFYTQWQIWFGLIITFLSGTAQIFWWKRMQHKPTKKKLIQVFTLPYLITLIITSLGIIWAKIYTIQYILLLLASVYGIVANASILFQISKEKISLSSGAVAHIGFALMLIGILFSAGYDKIISINRTGLLHSSEFSDSMNKENLLLFRNEPQQMEDYTLLYRGIRVFLPKIQAYIDKEMLLNTSNPFQNIAKRDISYKGKKVFYKGDTIHISSENTYYEIAYYKNDKEVFTLFPRIQINPQMGLVSSPDIAHSLTSDLYTHISGIPDPEATEKWSTPKKYELSIGDTFIVNDYIAILENVSQINKAIGVSMKKK